VWHTWPVFGVGFYWWIIEGETDGGSARAAFLKARELPAARRTCGSQNAVKVRLSVLKGGVVDRGNSVYVGAFLASGNVPFSAVRRNQMLQRLSVSGAAIASLYARAARWPLTLL
jgi:hypothetical protein